MLRGGFFFNVNMGVQFFNKRGRLLVQGIVQYTKELYNISRNITIYQGIVQYTKG